MKLLLLLALVASVATAQLDYVAIDIGPAFDEIYYVDMNAPGAPAGAPLASLAGNFIRGMELTAETTGWYVATSSSAGSPTGFFRIENGASTLVGPLPFTSTSVGGVSFSQAEDFLYYVIDPPTGDDTLYRIDFNGVFTTLAPITVPGGGAVSIHGIACDPLTGTLYAVDNGLDSLFTINTTTGVATLVGPLGVAVSAIGGLDFALDGSNRLFYNSASSVYELNPATGAVIGGLLGALPNGSSSSLMAIPSRVTMNVSPMTIGLPFSLSLGGGTPGASYGMVAALGGVYFPVPPFGVLRIDPVTAVEFAMGALDGAGAVSIGGVLPPDPALQNLVIYFQSYVVSPLTVPTVKATNHVVRMIM